MHNALPKLALPLLLGLTVVPAKAGLYAVDQTTYTEANGFFAAWYQDTHGRALDLCLSKAQSTRVPGSFMCNLLPNPGVFDDTQPIVFPTNFPDEAFWFTGDAAITDATTGIDLLYVSALEAAFSGELPAVGEQISFARVRIRVTVPVAGTYTITHPYGVEVFDVDTPGTRAINLTRDIGITTPGEFSGALKGDVGPFLRSVNGPYVEVNPVTSLPESFIGDPNVLEEVTGSPYGTNFVRIEGPNGLRAETRQFAISGKLSQVPLPTPLIVERATYSTGGTGGATQQDFFTLAPPAPATVRYTDTAGASGAMLGSATGAWYGQSAATPTANGNLSFTADNSAAIPSSTATTKTAPLVDLVTISRAEYSLATGRLTVDASSSDQTGQPVLTAEGLGQLIAGHLDLPAGLIPPATVHVNSANGGSDTEEVLILP
ncbi:hypothetical protein Pres01_43230 [Metapseudomonas resinovorans]|uniref:hypothetical protein n=1 Tax=Metapseudomonas resinovorans TaxID=53412 RepID=UPI0009846B04|nr:hypothetical protein [Pseudomonas resinovorans]GLZ88272.1 hypothetical protein Pres01_43230 [Pseudomonas resinovorans]